MIGVDAVIGAQALVEEHVFVVFGVGGGGFWFQCGEAGGAPLSNVILLCTG